MESGSFCFLFMDSLLINSRDIYGPLTICTRHRGWREEHTHCLFSSWSTGLGDGEKCEKINICNKKPSLAGRGQGKLLQ